MFRELFGGSKKYSNEFRGNIFSDEGLEMVKSFATDRQVSDDIIYDALFQLAAREDFVESNHEKIESLLLYLWLHRPGLRSQLKQFENFNFPQEL